jgi:hypothetical protein
VGFPHFAQTNFEGNPGRGPLERRYAQKWLHASSLRMSSVHISMSV